jgi:hypothetical protein
VRVALFQGVQALSHVVHQPPRIPGPGGLASRLPRGYWQVVGASPTVGGRRNDLSFSRPSSLHLYG